MGRHSTAKKASPQDWHPADVKAALEKAGWSLRQLAFHHGLCDSALRAPLRKPYPAAERRIADALGLHPMMIWPSRYDKRGLPNRRRGRAALLAPAISKNHRSTAHQRGHANSGVKN